MTATLILICHASTAAVRGAAFPGDEPLDRFGAADCAAITGRLNRADRAWAAPELRARQTALALGIAAEVEPALRECDYGRWAGRKLDEIATEAPDAVAEWLRDPDAARHGGESLRTAVRRVAAWLDARGGETGRSIVVTHATVIRAAIIHVLGAGTESLRCIDVAPLSTAVLSRTDRWRLRALGPIAQVTGIPAGDD